MKIILKDTNKILIDSDDVKNIKQSIFCGKNVKSIRDNNGNIHIEDVKKIRIEIECTAQAVPSLMGEYLGCEMILWCDQRLYELLEDSQQKSQTNIELDEKQAKTKLRYEYQPNTLALHKEETEISKSDENKAEITLYKDSWEFINTIPQSGKISYKPIFNACLVSFAMHTNEDLTSTCLMKFEEL